jgi:hypothetical protein
MLETPSPAFDARVEVPSAVGQLIYLASTRDYNTGEYYHAGLFFRHQPGAGAKALAICHDRVFRQVLLLPLQQLSREIADYLNSTSEPAKTTEAWRTLKAYQLLIPVPCDQVSAGLFCSNVHLALSIMVLEQHHAAKVQGHGNGGGGGMGPSKV